jgi:uncharacterized Zn-finger protein
MIANPRLDFRQAPDDLRLFGNGSVEIRAPYRYGVARQGGYKMAEAIVPHFHNDIGVPVIEIGAKEFMCVGAKPPFDHPHVFCDMGDDAEHVCPYCSTLYRYNATLAPNAARPAECALHDVYV